MLSKIFKREKGITLVALAVTIIVLIILASIGINLAFSDNGIIKEAQNAKESAEIDEEQGILKRAITISLIKSTGTNIEQSVLEKALNDEIGEGKTEVSDFGEGFEVMFTESNRYYEIDEEGKIGEVKYFEKEEYAGDITKGGRCDGSEEKPYEISCIEDLVVLSNMSNGTGIKIENEEAVQVTDINTFKEKYIILTRSLNFQSKYSYADSTRTDFGDINGDDTDGNMLITEMTTGNGFPSIGADSWNKWFRGNFDGENNSILNIYKNPLFNTASTASFKNLKLYGVKNVENTASLIETTRGATLIENISNYVNVKRSNRAGGIVNYSGGYLEIRNCANYGNIESDNYGAGGILGYCNGGPIYIENCYNLGNVVFGLGISYCAAGGIIGLSQSDTYKIEIRNSYSIGDISGKAVYNGLIAGQVPTKNSEKAEMFVLDNVYCKISEKWNPIGNEAYHIGEVTQVTDTEIKSESFVDLLNSYTDDTGAYPTNWKKWKMGDEGYPVFED